MGTSELSVGGNPVMDWHPIQGRVEIPVHSHATETKISSGLMGYLALMQTSPYLLCSILMQRQLTKAKN